MSEYEDMKTDELQHKLDLLYEVIPDEVYDIVGEIVELNIELEKRCNV